MITTSVALGDARFFAHEAMRTTFTLRFVGLPEVEARGLARECFELVDRLEDSLSRFREGGEVWRINHLRKGETLYVSDACHRCLLKTMDAYEATGGLFDVTLGRKIAHIKSGEMGEAPGLVGRLLIHPDTPAVTCEEAGREIDLGGIGKGFALDEIGTLLADWDIHGALCAAGASSMLAIGDGEWPIELAGSSGRLQVPLANGALSASGTGIQGSHIVHPVDDSMVASSQRVWVLAPSAASAEVWSTAVLLVPDLELPLWLAEGGDYTRIFTEGPQGLKEVFSK